jgi:hypothetical protein
MRIPRKNSRIVPQNLACACMFPRYSLRPPVVPSPLPSDGRGEGQGEISPKNSPIDPLNHTVLDMAGFAGQSNVKSMTDDCCSLSSGERGRVRAVVKTHFKFLSHFYDTIRFQVHGEGGRHNK